MTVFENIAFKALLINIVSLNDKRVREADDEADMLNGACEQARQVIEASEATISDDDIRAFEQRCVDAGNEELAILADLATCASTQIVSRGTAEAARKTVCEQIREERIKALLAKDPKEFLHG
jgi:hypothetical protein